MNSDCFSATDLNTLTNEWKILLAGTHVIFTNDDQLRLRKVLERERESALDWDEVLRLADHHGISPLLCRSLENFQGFVEKSALQRLQQRYDSNLRRSLFLARELIRITDCANSRGIEAIAYKGIALAEAYYGDMALRQTGDIDVFVRERDVLRMKTALRDLGFEPHDSVPLAFEQSYIESGYEWGFGNPAGQNLLELQWRLQPRFYSVDYDMDDLFSRAEKTKIADHLIKIPAPEDLLLVLSLHAAKHVWGRLIWLSDIIQILKRENLDWVWIQERTRELGIARIVHITLLLANRLLQAAIPDAIEGNVQADHEAQVLAQRIAESITAGASYEEQKLSYFQLMMSLRERRRDRLRFVTRLAFTPGPSEWKALRLPASLSSLYRVVRLGRLAARFARG